MTTPPDKPKIKTAEPVKITTQTALFNWLGDKCKLSKPRTQMPTPMIGRFDEMIEAFGATGWWFFDGSHDEFIQALLDGVEKPEAGLVSCGNEVGEFVGVIANTMRDVRHPRELRVHYLYALLTLLGGIAKSTKLLLWEDGEHTRLQSKKGFELRHGVSIDVSLFAKEGEPLLGPRHVTFRIPLSS
ncbi:hypothetical protein [Mesorhizobium sp. M7A.F.Ce.TU.012.03.2.1]|uniref:hypothetical protein n=1 Tax=Mesorhizobium sp. M7A.F.Ce.TU.012.03.2.1 TaxID=2493681 RepID=UPI000FD70263|nr:hypothetical protein [Mesorhizobium sp. M7A.F.Ce.TU.012.03.2.1]AZV18150.1 hypothetical protein EJ079_03100 [Mesorhizobium sp. M7A.F.Ce.TU.012.03.2.1]